MGYQAWQAGPASSWRGRCIFRSTSMCSTPPSLPAFRTGSLAGCPCARPSAAFIPSRLTSLLPTWWNSIPRATPRGGRPWCAPRFSRKLPVRCLREVDDNVAGTPTSRKILGTPCCRIGIECLALASQDTEARQSTGEAAFRLASHAAPGYHCSVLQEPRAPVLASAPDSKAPITDSFNSENFDYSQPQRVRPLAVLCALAALREQCKSRNPN